MWNDTDIPLAFLITFRSHGTWLHGDERGSVSRFRNQYKSRRLPPEKKWLETNTKRLRYEPVILDADQRGCVEAAAHETCKFRKWHLHAINVRTNHAHVVVSIGDKKPELALNAFKANATRTMNEMAAGIAPIARGLIRAARDIYGMKKVSRAPSIMCSTAKVMICRTLTTKSEPTADQVRTTCGSGWLILNPKADCGIDSTARYRRPF